MPGFDAFVQGVLTENGVRAKKKRPSMDDFMGQTLGGAGADAAPALSNIAPPSEMVYNPQTDIVNRPLELPEGMPGAPTFRQPGILERAARGAAMLGMDIVGGLRQGAAGVVNWAKPSTMETEHLAWLRDLPEDALQEALRSGKIPWQDTRYALLPPDARREALDRAIQFRDAVAEGVGSVADAISPETSPEKAARQYVPPAPQDPVRQAVQGIAGAVPGAAAMIGASTMGVPSPAIMAANVVAAQNAANEAVYNARMTDGAEHPEAYQAATGAGQVPQVATNLATTLAMLGAGRVLPMAVGGNVSPYVTQGLRTAAQMGAAAAGDAANSAIQDVRSGQDVDLSAAGTAGLQGLLQAGLFGLYNTARDWKKLQGLQGTHRQINETVRKINTAMEDLGLPKVNRQYGVNDASSMLSNSMRAGLLTPDRVFEALTKAGFDPAEVDALVRRGAPAQRGVPALHGAALPEQVGAEPVRAGGVIPTSRVPAPSAKGAPEGQLERVLSAVRGVDGQNARIVDLMRSNAGRPVQLPMLPSSVVGGDVAPEVAEQLSGFSGQLGPTPAKATEPSVTEGGLPREGIQRDKGLRQIREVINLVKTKEGRKNASRIVAEFAPVTEEQAQAISAATGEKVDAGFTHTIDGGYVFHVLRGHGEGHEKIQHQLPIVEEDFERIPDVVAHPDKIGSGNKTRQGLNTVAYSKRINGHILVVEAVRNGAKKLSVTTLRKLKPGYEVDFSTPDLLGAKETAKPLELTSNNDSQHETERSNAFGLKADEGFSHTSETPQTPSQSSSLAESTMPPFNPTLPLSKDGVKTEMPAAQPEAEMRGKGKGAEPFHANISIPARSKTHHFIAEQSRDSYSHEINILRRDDYTDSEGRSRVKFVNVGSYSLLTGEFNGNVAKGSDKTVLGKLRAQVLEQLRGAQPAEAETQEPPELEAPDPDVAAPDLDMMRDSRSVRRSEDYDPGAPKTWPVGAARDEALALEAWQNLEANEGIETWPESPEKTEALSLEKEYDKIAAWIENLSSEEFAQRLQNDDPEFTQKNERGVEIEERFHALRRSLSKKKPKNIEKRLSQLIEAEIDAAQEEALAAQEAENARIDAEDAEEYYHERPAVNENIRRGRAAMEKVIAEHTDVMDAMYRDDLGSISFLWGEPGRGPKFKGGAGVSHIIAHRNAQGYDGETVARKMVEVIAKGKVDRRYGAEVPGGERANIVYDGYTAALSLYKDGNRKTWLLTGWEDYKEKAPGEIGPVYDDLNPTLSEATRFHPEEGAGAFNEKSPGAPSEGDGSTGATLSEPMRTRPEEGAGASDTSKPQPRGKSKTERAEAKKEPVSVMDVTRRVREMFPLRHGLGSVPQGKRRGILGVFNRRSEVIRTKYRNNLPVIMHELGHALDKELKLRARIPEEALTELLRAGAPVSGEDYTPNQIANEGIAEFVRTYTISRKEGREEFPKFTPVFEKALHENPNVLKNFEEVRKTLEVYYKQDAKARILDKGPNTRGWSPATLKEKIKQLGHDFYTTWVDSNHELSRVSERVRETLSLDVLPDELNLYAVAQNSAGYMAAADKSVAKLLDVVKEHRMTPKDRSDLEAYMKAARALDYRSNGLLPGLGTTEAEERDIVEKQTPKHIREVAQQLHDAYEEIVQETLVDTGLMAQKTFDMLKEKWPNYVPFIRTDSEAHEDADVKDFLRGRTRSLVNIQNPIKKAKGVADEQEVMPVEEPLLHMLNNVVRYHHMAAKQGVAEVIREISKREGCGWIAERLEGHPAHSDDSTFYIWENGKQVYYATDPAIHKVLKGLNQGSVFQRSLVGRLLSLPSETLKMGATRYNPAFIITNALRDAAQVSITSRSWAPPLAHTIKGVMMLYSGKRGGKWKELVDEAINEQVFYSGITDIVNSSPGELKRALRKAFNSGGRLSKAWDAFRDAAEKVGAINEYIEVAPKLSEYYHLTRERGVPKREAARQAREANLDFQRAGTWGRGANSVIAFFNAGVQGTDKILRAFREHPGQSMAKAFLYITLPSILAWALAHKDEKTAEEYRQISKWKKDLAWCVKLGGKWWSIPKPPVLGQVFGSLTERVLDAAFDKDAASMRGFSNTLVDQAVPNLMPTVFLPALEAYVNYNFFRDQPVVPRGKEKLPPELQYGPGTSGLAKWVGEKTGQSPYKIDHLIRGYAGTVGGELSKAPDRLFNDGNRPEEYWTEKPFIRSFFIDPSRTNESIERFYELATRTETAKNGYLARRKAGETGKADREVMLAKMFQKVKQDLSEINGAIAAVQEDKGLPPSQKRKRINDLREKAILAAKWALAQYDRHRD